MGIGVSIFLIAVGAILRFAVTTTTRGLNIGVVGLILMIVGGLGLLLSLLFWSSVSPARSEREETVIREELVDHHHHL